MVTTSEEGCADVGEGSEEAYNNGPGIIGIAYDEDFLVLGLYSLVFRKMKGDLIETYRKVKGLDRGCLH